MTNWRRVVTALAAMLALSALWMEAEESRPMILQIPVEFYPKIEKSNLEDGTVSYAKRNAEGTLNVASGNTVAIFIDTWSGPGGIDEFTPLRQRQQRFLEFCRQNGIAVIFAPNLPAAAHYPQYHTLKEKVEKLTEDYDVRPRNPPPFMSWPPAANDAFEQGRALRRQAREEGAEMPRIDLDISRHLQPLPTEYVLTTYMELRYVLWQEQATCLLYVGEYLNECIQQRETGINRIAGTDKWREPLQIVILKDLVAFDETEDIEEVLGREVMLDYFKRKLAFVSDSTALEIVPVKN